MGEAAGRKGRRLALTLGSVALAAVVVTLLIRSMSGRTALDASELFTVARRSFPVLLREKGELKAAKSVDIKSDVEGRATIIWLIDEGTQVKKGDLLVRLASDQIEEKIRTEEIKAANSIAAVAAAEKEHEILLDQNASDQRRVELALRMARIEKQKYLEGDWQQSLLDMQLELDRAQMVLSRTQEQLIDSEDLHAKGFITESDLWRDRISAFEADIAVKKAKLLKEISLQYTHPKELEQRESDVSEGIKELERVKKSNAAKASKSASELKAKQAELAVIQERLAKFTKQRADCEIHAPQDGLVVYESGRGHWDNRQIAEGAEVHERQTIIKLPDPRVMVVTVRIHEANTDKIAIGQHAQVSVEGLPGAVFTGKVTKIAPLADSQNRWLNPDLKEYETEITLDQSDDRLKPGVT
ncbi:MAG: HlyD family secretion protein, partial [Phycisphaerae bacterium]